MAKSISILNKIHNKPLLMQKIFPYLLNRPTILVHLISDDNKLKSHLNNVFSGVKKKTNNLEKELIDNLKYYSFLREVFYNLYKWYFKINQYIINEKLFDQADLDLETNLYNNLEKFLQTSKYQNILKNSIKKKIVFDYLSSLDNIPVFYNNVTSNNDYIKYIENKTQTTKKKINLVLLIDEKKFINYYIPDIIKINQIEIIKIRNKTIDDLFLYLNQFFYNQEKTIKNVNCIYFHNEIYKNYFIDNYSNKTNNDKYQCLISMIIDKYNLKENLYTKSLFKIFEYLIEIKIENLDIIYIYEQFKIYYYIINFFPSLSSINNYIIHFQKNNQMNINYYIINNKVIININNNQLKIKDLILFINSFINNHKNIQYLYIVNQGKLIKEENEEIEENLDVNNLKEFMFVNKSSYNNIEIIKNYILSNEENNKYEGYDNYNKLIFYREGETIIQSFDLIELFKYNEKLFEIKLIKEQIIIKYNIIKNYLEIKYNGEPKKEILPLCHFTQFIFNQNNLKELKINKFDYKIEEVSNKSISKLSINYEKDINTIQYSIIENQSIYQINKYLPNLSTLNIGGNYKWISYFSYNNASKSIKEINIITENNSEQENKSLQNKYDKFGIKISFDFINKEKNKIKVEEENANKNKEKNPCVDKDISIKDKNEKKKKIHKNKHKNNDDI